MEMLLGQCMNVTCALAHDSEKQYILQQVLAHEWFQINLPPGMVERDKQWAAGSEVCPQSWLACEIYAFCPKDMAR